LLLGNPRATAGRPRDAPGTRVWSTSVWNRRFVAGSIAGCAAITWQAQFG
jgi:hypothetical protein